MTAAPAGGNDLVCIILVNWNGWRDTVACLESCAALRYAPRHVIVVDNGSTDGSVARLRERFPELHIIDTGANLGFASANNVGMHAAFAMGAAYVWLLNNDTVVDPDALGGLVNAMRADRSVAMACSRIRYFDRPQVLWYAGGFLSPRWGWSMHRGAEETDVGQYEAVGDVDFATGCSLLARADAVRAIGPMDEHYFLYWEDVDWSTRALACGWRVVYVPDSLVWHKLGGSTQLTQRHRNWRYEGRNRLRFYARQRPTRLPRVMLASLLNAGYLLARGRRRDAFALLEGMADAALGRRGILRSRGG